MQLCELIPFLEYKAFNLRVLSLQQTTQAGSGHPTSCLSAADIVAVLFFHTMAYDIHNFYNPDNDHFILSKGHAAPLLYAAWSQVGLINPHDLLTYRHIDSRFEGHPTPRFEYAEAATGSLGMGLSIGVGMALNGKIDKRLYKTYVLLGDSEITEGSVWEAVQIAAHYKLDNLVAIVDCNKLGQSNETLYAYDPVTLEKIFSSFGWHVHTVDGHNIGDLVSVFDSLKESYGAPTVILAQTIKGFGVHDGEGAMNFHGRPFTKHELATIIPEMQQRFYGAAHYDQAMHVQVIRSPQPAPHAIVHHEFIDKTFSLLSLTYQKGDYEATRKSFGKALVGLGSVYDSLVVLDAEVKNSTYTQLFDDVYPERFIECFIAEQNMVSMGVGLNHCKKMVFMATFAAFFSRAYDQIRMAAIGRSTIKLVGSHCGVSIGQDGPSQMGLEDIAFMRAIPHSVVLYPCDAVSTYKLVTCMAQYNEGITYLRTTRMETEVIYDQAEQFVIGGLKVLHESDNDVACVVAAGVTVHEALKAYAILQEKGISIAVIDLYSIKPLDRASLERVGTKASSRIITIEDHYHEGGLGEAVATALATASLMIESCAVTGIPGSGQPDEQLARAGIDAAALIKKVMKL